MFFLSLRFTKMSLIWFRGLARLCDSVSSAWFKEHYVWDSVCASIWKQIRKLSHTDQNIQIA